MPRPAAEELVELVLRVAELVPVGRVVTYGDIAGLVGTGPRQVGAVMATWGSGVPWWRVVNAAGELPAHLRERAIAHWRAEGVAVKENWRGCRIAAHRADLVALADAVAASEGAATAAESAEPDQNFSLGS